MAVAGAVFFAAGRGDCSRGIFNCWLLLVLYFLLVVDAGLFTVLVVLLVVGCSWGIFNCWLLLVLYFLRPVAVSVLVVCLVVRWGIDESVADTCISRSMGLYSILDFLLPAAATVFVVLLLVGLGIDGFAADLFCGGPATVFVWV